MESNTSNSASPTSGSYDLPLNLPPVVKKNFYVTEVENGYTVSFRNSISFTETTSIALTIEEVITIVTNYLKS